MTVNEDKPVHAVYFVNFTNKSNFKKSLQKPELVKYLEAVQQALKIAVRLENTSNNDNTPPPTQNFKGDYVIVTTTKHLYTHYSKVCVFMGILEEEGFELTIASSTVRHPFRF